MANSRVFKVATIAMLGLGNVVFRYGDEVQESQLNGNADELVKAGYIKLKEVFESDNIASEDAEEIQHIEVQEADEKAKQAELDSQKEADEKKLPATKLDSKKK